MPGMDDFKGALATIRKQTGLEMLVPDDEGLVTFRVDDKYNVCFQYIEGTGKVLCFVEICELPPSAGVAVYRDLLAGSLFGRETAGGYFALEPKSNIILYNCLFDFDPANTDPKGFAERLESILQLVEIWAERIRTSVGVNPGEEMDGEDITVEALRGNSVSFFRP